MYYLLINLSRHLLIVSCLFFLTFLASAQNKKKPKDYRVAASADPLFSIPYNGKYTVYYSDSEYQSAFYEEFIDHLNYKGIQILKRADTSLIKGKDFYISVNEVIFQESEESETVNDPDRGTICMNYISCAAIVKFTVHYLPDRSEIKSTDITVSKDEKVTNRRTIFDIIFKVPEEEVSYRVKELSDDVFLRICKRSARKSANKAVRIIEREVKRFKKGK